MIVVRMTGSFVIGPSGHRASGPVLSLVVDEASGEAISVVLTFHPSTLPALPSPTVIYRR